MATSSPTPPSMAHAFEPPQPSPHKDARPSLSHHASSSSKPPGSAHFPPVRPHCLKCQPILHHSHSTASVPTNHPADSTTLVTPAHHVTVRQFIGPLPVSASAAKAIAKAIAEDSSYEKASSSQTDPSASSEQQPSEPDQEHQVHATDHAAPPSANPSSTDDTSQSHTWTDPFRVQSPAELQQLEHKRAQSFFSTSPKKQPATLPPPRPRVVKKEASSTSVLSNASYVSAQSFDRDALSDTEAANRARPTTATTTSTSSSHPRSISPTNKRFLLRARKSNQSFPVSSAAAAAFQPPPTSILRNVASFGPLNRGKSQLDPDASPSKSIGNVRSADNLRVSALRQQRRIGSEGSRVPISAASSPHAATSALPVLDLPLNELEEAISGVQPPRDSTQPQPLSTYESSRRSNGHASTTGSPSSGASDKERRALNSSNDTTIIRRSNDGAHHGNGDTLKHMASFSSNSESNAAESHNAETTGPQDRNLLHPAWEQASAASAAIAPTTAPEAHVDTVQDESSTLPNAGSPPDLRGGQRSPTKASRNLVGRGLPVKKRSLTFTGEQSTDSAQRGPSAIHLPRAVDHHRDYSRQSRMSRASTVGTFNTVGTVATEGSFGATAGASSSLARKFLAGGSFRRNTKRADSAKVGNQRVRMGPTRTDSVREPFPSGSPSSARTRKTASPFAVRQRHAARSTSHASLRLESSRRFSASGTEASLTESGSLTRERGVQPGAVGTSAGGTKWVGESFQVGERFWHILNARRDELQKAQPCSCGNNQGHSQNSSEADSSSQDSDASRRNKAEEQAAKVEHLKKSPDGVITLLAQQAQDISDDKATEAQADAQRKSSTRLPSRQLEMPPTDASASSHTDKAESRPSSRRQLLSDDSAATIQTVHPDETAPLAIEARQGWSEIVSKMSSLTGELGNSLKARKLDRQKGASSPHGSQPTPKEEKPNNRLGADFTKTKPERNGSPRLPVESDFKILARSSSLVESDRSSAASNSVYASLHPSAHTNGIAPRASSLATGKTPTMTRSDALSHPPPPASVEANNPELVHQLLRRKSDLGEKPEHLADAASDHAVAVRPVSSPRNITPAQEIASPYDGHLSEQDPLPLDTSPVNEREAAAAQAHAQNGLLKAIGLATSVDRKKTVKFDTGSARPPLKGRFTASLFAGKADDNRIKANGGAGDAQPRPPAEVLARPQPHALQAPSSADGSSPSSEVHESETSIITRKSVLKKDRMLVKIAWTPHEDLPSDFDELQARKYSMREEDWREFVVVFRMGKLELWTDPTLTNKLIGHGDRLKLRLTIPLSRSSTFVSLFSPIDRIFCLTFQPWKSFSAHQSKRGLHLRRQGTDIVLFDCRARSVAADWMWELWRELGGLIPESLEVHVPSFGLKVRIPVPESMPVERPESTTTPASQLSSEKGGLLALSSIGKTHDGGEGFKLVNRNNVISMIWKLFCRIEQWKDIMEQAQNRGLRLELAWRRGTELDWVINERTVENEPRHWAVLSGALLRDYKHPSILELRAAAHYPTTVSTAPGEYMQEPPAVEGFLWRVKPVSGALTRLYFTTYDGHIYVCRTSRAFPPDRHLAVQMQEAVDMRVPRTSGATQGRAPKASTPATKNALTRALAKFVGANKAARRDEDVATLRQNVLEAISYPAQTEEEFQGQIEAYQSFETRRQFEQIRGSDGFIDLKHIHTIKTIGNGPVRCPGEDDIRRSTRAAQGPLMRKVKDDLAVAQRDDEESDDEGDAIADIGGQEGLEVAEDANDVRRARQIEITLTNGKKIRLEAFSASIAREWVERIAELVKYWRRRERADAVELMYAAGVDISELHKQLQGRSTHTSGIEGVDEQKLSPILGNIWNWCQIEGCRNIIRSGKLFHKKSSYSAFKARDYVLIAGRLLCFKLVKSVRTTRARQNNGIFHRRQDTVIHLRDAYVYSGKLSEDMLKNGRSDPAQAVSGIGGGGSNSGKRHRVPRVYADGLFSVDDDEDCTFVIRYRPERVNTPANPSVTSLHGKDAKAKARGKAAGTSAKDKKEAQQAAGSVPRLDDKTHKYIAMRARSKVERDLWVRCITFEIEKIVRDDVERETKLKNTGKVDHK